MHSIEGEYCRIETWDGSFYDGTVLFDKTSVHAHGMDDASGKRSRDTMYVRLDCDVKSGEEVRQLGISPGNYVHMDPRTVITETGFIKSRHLDDKSGVAILLVTAGELKKRKEAPVPTVEFLITCYEEVGHGASSLPSEGVTDFIAVDMGVAGPDRESSEMSVSICAADSSGPFSYTVTRDLIDTAEEAGIPYSVDTFPHYGSDAASALRSGMDARHGLIGPGIDASHAMERAHSKGLCATVDLLLAYIGKMGRDNQD